MDWLLLLAILAQTADATVTCANLRAGGQELNPLVPSTCRGAILQKAAIVTIAAAWPARTRRWALGTVAAAGVVGATVSLTWGRREPE